MKEEVYLTTLELLYTCGFIKIMSLIWFPFIIIMVAILVYKENTKFKGRY